jgi:nucleotide-binding universal stress UspA family protein
MLATQKKRVLVAIDGSKRSLQTIEYMTQASFFRDMEINLFHVFISVPDAFWDLTREPSSIKTGAHVRAWESQKRKEIESHLSTCKAVLLDADFQPDKISISVQNRRNGIARDIIAESSKGYGFVLLRRRGMTQLSGLIMGSVAYKLLDHIDHTPLILAGKKPVNHRVLVAMDGSACALRALELVAHTLVGKNCEITLVNVLRKSSQRTRNDAPGGDLSGLPEELGHSIQHILYDAKAKLLVDGFEDHNIRIETITHAHSRAGAIVAMAEERDISTIVVGRKGISRVHEFSMGRVCNKVLHIGREFHIWITN